MYIIGAGGHGKVIAEIAELNDFMISSFIDQDITLNQALTYGVIHEFPVGPQAAVVAIGNNMLRKNIVAANPYIYPVLIHPKTCISSRALIGEGSVIIGGATINSNATIGKHVIINTNASVGHDCVIGDFVHIAPNVALAGNVVVGEGTNIGLGTSVIQGITIGQWCVIGAGTVVVKDIPNGAIVVGNPARIINKQEINTGSALLTG